MMHATRQWTADQTHPLDGLHTHDLMVLTLESLQLGLLVQELLRDLEQGRSWSGAVTLDLQGRTFCIEATLNPYQIILTKLDH